MALTHTTATKNVATDAVVDQLNGALGNLVFMTSGDVEVATIVLQDPAFGASTPPASLLGVPLSDTNATGGTIAKFKLETFGTTEILRGSVSTSGADINLTSVVIAATETVTITSLTYQGIVT